jgi:hypothetical protein
MHRNLFRCIAYETRLEGQICAYSSLAILGPVCVTRAVVAFFGNEGISFELAHWDHQWDACDGIDEGNIS